MPFAIRALFAAALLSLAVPHGARAQSFELPGLDADATAFMAQLGRPYPAGGNPTARAQAEARAAAAERRGDWTGVATALEDRAGQEQVEPGLWLRLAQAELKRVPPAPGRALQAAWVSYQGVEEPAAKAAAMVVAAQALAAQARPAQAAQALREAVRLQPDDAGMAQQLADANRAAGMLVARVVAHEETDPARVCIVLTIPPSRRNDFHPEDWVRLTPPVPDAAITREGDQICVSGLPLAATTRATLRAGMPAEGGLSLKAATEVPLALGNRPPLLAFNSRLFLLPRGQAPRVVLTSSNVARVKIAISLFTERTLLPWAKDNALGSTLQSYQTFGLSSTDQSRVVWSGRADVPGFKVNEMMRGVLPLPAEAMATPGLYTIAVRPDDGQNENVAGAVQPVLMTDLAPTVWRGTDGLTVQVRAYSDAKPRPGTRLRLLATNNDVLAETQADADGIARFAAPLLHGEGVMAPAAIQAMQGDTDFVSLALDGAAFDLSDRGVSGAKQPGALDAFLWTDRGIYRPGETIQVMALLRDNGGAPVERAAHIKVLRPNGEVFSDSIVTPGGGGSLHLPVTLSQGANAGIWGIQVLSDPKAPPVGELQFKVDAFIPDRMAVTLGTLPAQIGAGQSVPVPVNARFLYGAPAAHLAGSAAVHLVFAPKPPAGLEGYEVGLVDEAFAPQASHIELAPTDDAGHTMLPLHFAGVPDTTHALQANLDVEVDDPSGHATHIPATIPVRPEGVLIGVKRLFRESVDAGAEAGFDIAALDPDGGHPALPVRLRLLRERPDWRLVHNGNLASYETVWHDEPLETRDLLVPAGGVLHFARNLDFGRYRIEVAQKDGLAASSLRFRSGWASASTPDVPDRADVSADRRSYAPGAVARVHVAAPFAGPATLLVLTDRVRATRLIDLPAGGGDFDVPVDAAWGPGAYVAVHVFRPARLDGGGGSGRPDRAIGLTWLGIDPAARRLEVAFDAPDLVRPRATAHASLRTAPGAWVSIAAVDEGILHLTDYASPDAAPHFLGRRALGVDIRDDWGRLILPADGATMALRQGGDEGAARRPNIPQQIVSLFIGPVRADAAGHVDVPLPYPDFNGQVRLMAVAWDGNRLGAAATDMLVRDQLIAEPLLPRFMAPGDTARMAVLLQNLDLPDGAVTVGVSADGPLAIQGTPTLRQTLVHGAQVVPTLMLRATGQGAGHVRLDVSGPDGFHALHEATLDIHSVRPRDSAVLAAELGPNATAALAPPIARFVAGTWRASASFGGGVRYDAAALMRKLDAYPMYCLEQAASKGLPLAVLPDGAVAGPERASRLQVMVNAVLDRQRFDGAFGLWSGTDEAQKFLTLYATEFLLRARKAGATVGDTQLADALKFEADQVGIPGDKPEDLAEQAYRLYVLALAGQPRAGAARVLFETLDKLPTPLARAQLAAALALGNDTPRAEAAFAAALDAPARNWWAVDYGSPQRDQAATALLLRESGLLPDRLATLRGRLPGANLKPEAASTQEAAWLVAASGALGRTGAVTRVSLDDRSLPPAPLVTAVLTGPATARNDGEAAIWQSVSVTGVLAQPAGDQAAAMRVTRKLFNLDGSPLDPARVRQNTVFVLLLEGAATDAQAHQVAVLQGLPAGWEIAGRLASGMVAGMPWLGTLTETQATPAADDSFQSVVVLAADKPGFRLAVRLRAVTPGNFELPGSDVSDMYRPGVFARLATARIDVLPAP